MIHFRKQGKTDKTSITLALDDQRSLVELDSCSIDLDQLLRFELGWINVSLNLPYIYLISNGEVV